MIIRDPIPEQPFVIIYKTVLNDTRLSAKAKGIYAYICSLPVDWKIYETELVKHFEDGMSSLRSGLKELKDMGYLERITTRDESGQFTGADYILHHEPMEIPILETPVLENHISDNHTLLNNNNTNNNNTKKEKDLKPLPAAQKPISNSRILSDYFCTSYLNKYNTKYQFETKDGVLLNSLLKAYDLDFMKAFIDWFFNTSDNFIDKAGRSVGVLKASRDKYIAVRAQEERDRETMRQMQELRRKANE